MNEYEAKKKELEKAMTAHSMAHSPAKLEQVLKQLKPKAEK